MPACTMVSVPSSNPLLAPCHVLPLHVCPRWGPIQHAKSLAPTTTPPRSLVWLGSECAVVHPAQGCHMETPPILRHRPPNTDNKITHCHRVSRLNAWHRGLYFHCFSAPLLASSSPSWSIVRATSTKCMRLLSSPMPIPSGVNNANSSSSHR